MTWTVFEHNAGDNETLDDAPGRGGYTYVLVPLHAMRAYNWWRSEYGTDPGRTRHHEDVWIVSQYENEVNARKQCGVKTVAAGGIGSRMTRPFTWNELHGRLDVRAVTAEDI